MSVKKQTRQNTGSTVWTMVLAWLGSLLLVVLTVLLLLYSTLCSASYMQGQIHSSGYAQSIYEVLVEDFTSYGAATGFDAATMTGFLNVDQIERDMNDSIDGLYADTLTYYTRSNIAESAYSAMETAAQARGITLEGESKAAVEAVAEAVRMEYSSYTAVPLVSQLRTIVQKVEKVMWIGVAACAVLLCVAVVSLVCLGRKDARLSARSLVFMLAGAALVCLVLGVGVVPMMNLQRLGIEPLALKNFIVSYIEGMFGRFLIFAGVYFVLSLLVGELLLPHKRRDNTPRYVMDADNNPIEDDPEEGMM